MPKKMTIDQFRSINSFVRITTDQTENHIFAKIVFVHSVGSSRAPKYLFILFSMFKYCLRLMTSFLFARRVWAIQCLASAGV